MPSPHRTEVLIEPLEVHLHDLLLETGKRVVGVELDEPLPIRGRRKVAEHDFLAPIVRTAADHRDLKPGNIMLTKSVAKLMDVGLAKLWQPGG